MDRIGAMGFPDDLNNLDDMVDMVLSARRAGADIKVDGWSATIVGVSKLATDFIQEIKDFREALIFHFIVICPHPCESCWGVGVKQNEDGNWFCTAHYPDNAPKEKLWQLARAQTRMSDQITEYANRPDHDHDTYQKMLDDHQRRGDLLAQMWRSIEPKYPSTL